MTMDETTHSAQQPASLSTTTSWESWVDTLMLWMPYATLALSVVLAQLGSQAGSDRVVSVGLAAAAGAWTWVTFTRKGLPSRLPQRTLRIYFVGFAILGIAMMFRAPVFLVYGITGFFHGSLLRPWWTAFLGIGIAGLIIHSHIVITESTVATWAIYLGVVAIQTVTVAAGLYGGHRISEVAEERRHTLERLELAMAENAGLHDQLVAQAREAGVLDVRQRMAREIHDTIAQGLTGVITQIEAINQSWGDDDEMRRRLDTASELARHSLAEARRSVQAIVPSALEDTRLADALADEATRWADVNGVPVQVHTTGKMRPLRPEVEVTLLRAVQEGLANVAKHAAASRAGVTLSFMDDSVALDVRDDGSGFDAAGENERLSFGLAAMKQRVANIGGEMSIESSPGEGTAVSVRIPTTSIGSSDE